MRLVSTVISPPADITGIDLALLLLVFPKTQLARIFSANCLACSSDHLAPVARLSSSVRRHVHPDAHADLRAARVPFHLLAQPHLVDKKKTSRRGRAGIPVYKDREKTRLSQILWANQYADRNLRTESNSAEEIAQILERSRLIKETL